MSRNGDVARVSEYGEDSLAKAKRVAVALCDLLEHAEDNVPTDDRAEIRYIEALARTLSDSLASIRHRRAA